VTYVSPGHHRSLRELRDHLEEVAPALGCDEVLEGADGPFGAPLERAGFHFANRFAIQPMEGWDGTLAGAPSDDTLRRWRRFGRSGAKLIWGGEAFAVCLAGRANPRQLFLNDEGDVESGLGRLLEELRAGHAEVGEDPDQLVVVLQLTHSGRWAQPTLAGPEPCLVSHHPELDARVGLSCDDRLLSDGELEHIRDRYVLAARMASRVGFHFVDVKCCHGYLMHELLGADTRPGRYGGDFEGRTRLFVEVVEGIRASCPELGIGVRLSVGDLPPHTPHPETGVGHPRGAAAGFGMNSEDPASIDLTEPLRFIGLCRSLGIELINQTLGSPYYCPHLLRPASHPPSDGYLPPEDPLASVEAHLLAARAVRRAEPGLGLVGTGYSYLQEWLPHVGQHELRAGHTDFVGLGRVVLSYPELPLDVLRGRTLDRRRICRTFSDCTTAPRNGAKSGCYPLDPYYRESPEAEAIRSLRRRKS